MMRAVLLLLGFTAATAADQAACAVDGARAADDLLDAGLYIWAAIERCNTSLPSTVQDPIRCSLNVASAIESVNAMVNVVLKAVEKCAGLESVDGKCGLAIGVLTRAFAGLAASSSGVAAKCPNALNNNKPLTTYQSGAGGFNNPGINAQSALGQAAGPFGFGYCLVDIKDTFKSMFKAMKRIITIRDDCKGGAMTCAHNSEKLVAAVAAIGEYISGALSRCTSDPKLRDNAACAEQALNLERYVADTGRASVRMAQICKIGEARMYEIEQGIADEDTKKESNGNTMTVVLGAFLPFTAVVAFVAGTKLKKTRVYEDEDLSSQALTSTIE